MNKKLYKRFINLIRCPSCYNRLKVEAFENCEEEIVEGLLVCSCGMWYPVTNGIPRLFVSGSLRPYEGDFLDRWAEKIKGTLYSLSDKTHFESEKQVQKTFGYKWTKQYWWGIDGTTAEFMEQWLLPRYGWKDKEHYKNFFMDKTVCLDAGCGLGREALRMASVNPEALVIGLELSECVDEARKHVIYKNVKNVFFVQADLNHPPLAKGEIDFIISEGVLHHTPDTRKALEALTKLLSLNGEIGFYIYRKKAPLREYADDFIREKLYGLDPEQSWKQVEPLTRLGKTLSELDVSVEIEEDVPLLGIKAGKYDLQRLIYYTMFKCFWNSKFSFEENVHINFDWYTPRFSWRHTEEEIKGWIYELGLVLTHQKIEESGITSRGKFI